MTAEELRGNELALVGCVLDRCDFPEDTHGDTLDILDAVNVDDFADPEARSAWREIRALCSDESGFPSSIAVISAAGLSFSWLADLRSNYLAVSRTRANMLELARIVADDGRRRRVQAGLKEAATIGDASDAMMAALRLIEREDESRTRPAAITAAEEWLRMQAESGDHRKRGLIGLPSGFQELDRMTGGLEPGWLIVAGGRTSVGKSLLAVGTVSRCILDGRRAVIISTEMDAKTYRARLAAWDTNVSLPRQKMQDDLTDGERFALERAYRDQDAAGLMIRNDLRNFDDICRFARREAMRGDLALLVVDYVQNIRVRGVASIYERMSIVGEGLLELAQQVRAPLLALSQLSNSTAREGAEHIEFKGAGEIAASADLGLFLLDDDKTDKTSRKIEVRKNRNGRLGDIRLRFNQTFTRFDEVREGYPTGKWGRGNKGADYAARD